MDLRAIEIFLSVCQAGGVTAAAGQVGVSQAAVSQRMAQLERELGTPLFDRSARPYRLTPAGALLRERAMRIVSDVQDLQHLLKGYRTVEVPELRIGIIESIAPALVPHLVPALRGFVGALSVTSGIVGPLVPELLRNNMDIIVTTERLDDLEGIERHTLIGEPFVLVLPAGMRPPTDLAALDELGHRLAYVGYGSGHRMSATINRELDRHGLVLPRALNFVSSAPIIDLVRQGQAWSIMTPLCLYSGRVQVGELVVAPIPEMQFSRFIDLAAPAHRLGDVAQRMTRICTDILTSHVLPELARHAPFAADRFVCGDLLASDLGALPIGSMQDAV
ncbi:LysR family transcriptional regulator [Mongoliimonas terrestris]|uniref:LysR family transcriptional regulator n=1 Tax=Mongoliimonas terrestris TaxID=1709001 RepID=UPI0009497372|nr:LysR family transcriptional regulator [Mongoliimonas terrestris]